MLKKLVALFLVLGLFAMSSVSLAATDSFLFELFARTWDIVRR
jgi:hypothetical protein